MKNLTLENITRVCHGTYHGDPKLLQEEVVSITTDSRKAAQGCLFVAIVGERVDAHRFIPQVLAAGALASLSERELSTEQEPYIQVSSSLEAVKEIAAFYLEQLSLPVVGISGSVGKTSTKEMIASVLGQRFHTLKTEGNFNNELGLPLTVFRLREEHQIAVLEMGISDFGEMSRLAAIARPNTGVITNIGTCHLEFLGDRDGVLRAKTEMLEYIRPEGNIVLNGDDDKLCTVKERGGTRPVTFGLSTHNDYFADEIENQGLEGQTCTIHLPGGAFRVHIPVPGQHQVYNALAATAVGTLYGLTPEEIRAGIEGYTPISGRFRLVRTSRFLVVDDCYNANPMSMKASLDALGTSKGRRIAILGDMGELGENEIALHEEVGRHAAGSGLAVLFCTGELSRHLAEAARQQNPDLPVFWYEDREPLLQDLKERLEDGDTILVKASHFMHFEKVVEALTAM